MNKKVTTTEIKKEITKVDKDVDLLEQKTQKIEDLISKIEDASNDLDKTMSLSIGELEERAKKDVEASKLTVEELVKHNAPKYYNELVYNKLVDLIVSNAKEI